MKLLIVDDSQFIRDTVKRKTEDLDIDVYEACDADSAIRAYKEHVPDLVFMDIMMREEDGGVVAIREIKKHDKNARIVVITSLGDNDPYVKDAIDLGVIDVITKPFNKEEIYRYLNPDSTVGSKFS